MNKITSEFFSYGYELTISQYLANSVDNLY